MLQRRRLLSSQHRRVFAMLFVGFSVSSTASGQTPSAELQLNAPAIPKHHPEGAKPKLVAPETVNSGVGPAAGEPINSTLELRIVRRPWLLDKLLKPTPKERSVKMRPPTPPAAPLDPPSMILAPLQPPAPDQTAAPLQTAAPVQTAAPDQTEAQPQSSVGGDGWVARGPAGRDGQATQAAKPTEELDSVNSGPEPANSSSGSAPTGSGSEPASSGSEPTGSGTMPNKDSSANLTDPVDSGSVPAADSDSRSGSGRDAKIDSQPGDGTDAGKPATLADRPNSDERTDNHAGNDGAGTDEKSLAESAAKTGTGVSPENGGSAGVDEAASLRKKSHPPSMEVVKVREIPLQRDGSPHEDHADTGRDQLKKLEVDADPQVVDSTRQDSSQPPPSEAEVTEEEPEVRLDYAGYPQSPLQLSRTVRGMQNSLRRCLQHYYARPEIATARSNWGMLHSIMVYGIDTKIIVGRKQYSAIAWIAGNNSCRGQRLLTAGPRGIEAKSGIGLQGHQGQMLAVFSLCDVPENYPLYANNKKFLVGDVINAEMAACKSGEELTFTLIALAHYLDTDESWVADGGQHWDFERLIREELSQPIVGAACGGTHRLMAFAHALRKRRAEGKPMTGQWKRAELFTQDFVSYCYRLQNRDGSMSTDWFEGRENNGDLDRRVQTTGHMVEWLLTVAPDSELQNPQMVRAIRFLLNSMYSERDHEWKIGPKGHALRSLAMYYQRVYRAGPAWRTQSIARSGEKARR